jgi:tetratricopeptide (TPR) repeat protein
MTDDIRHSLDNIVQLINDGRVDDAESLCAEKLRARPDDVNLTAMMGAILIKSGALSRAEEFLHRAIEIEPAFAKPHEDLGTLNLSRNEAEKAIPHYRKALAIDPGLASAVRGLAQALKQAGREDEAETLRIEFMQALPTEALLAEAEALCNKGQTRDAEQICDVVLSRDPESIAALRVLALAAVTDERFIIAEGYLKRMVRLAPKDATAQFELGKFLNDRGRYPEAIELLTATALASPENPDIHRKEEARDSYQHCVEVSPDFGTAWWYLASLHGFEASDDQLATMLAELERENLAPESIVGFHFALARAFEHREDFAAAWQHYEKGNAGKRQLVKYDPVKAEVDHAKIRATYSAEMLAQKKAADASDVVPIFIVGMPRSGSTLIEQILASHSQIEGTGELPYIIMMTKNMVAEKAGSLHYTELVKYLSPDDLARSGASYLANAESHRVERRPFFTDKMPANFSHVGLIRSILPQARFIDARREPMATCVANYRQLFALGKNQSYDLVELGEYYLQYIEMMNHWDDVMPGGLLRVRYEDVVGDLESQVRRILDYCGLPFEEACLEFHKSARPVNTASAEQVREPIYKSGVEFWRNYDPWIDELRDVLSPIL